MFYCCTHCCVDRGIAAVICLFWFASLSSGSVGGIDAQHLLLQQDEGNNDDDAIVGDERREYSYYIEGLTQDIDGDDVITTTHYGRLRGKRRMGHPNIGVVSAIDWFLGIPYASPPTGQLRFNATRPPDSWLGTRNATRYGSVCPQVEIYEHYATTELQNEDCLYMNIYSPAENETAPLTSSVILYPVMVYIHGGSYRAGSGSVYVGHLLAQHGVVVVTFNYRLGLLGFLSARHASLEGNYGLLDQIEALRWIQFNIKAFGGDPSRVTIFGNSAGGSSVGLISASPLADGLYSQIIMQSGSPLAFWAVHDRKLDLVPYVRSLAAGLSCDRPQLSDLVECLRDLDWKAMVMVSGLQLSRITPSGDDIRPVPDGRVLPDSPKVLLDEGRMKARAVMTGIAAEEWSRHLGFFLDDMYEADRHLDNEFRDGIEKLTFEAAIDHVICTRFGYDQTVSKLVQHQYTNFMLIEGPVEYRKQYIDFITDMAMTAPTVQTAALYHKHNIPVYLYQFSHHVSSEHSAYQEWQTNYHEIELNYIFGSPLRNISTDFGKPEHYTAEDEHLSRFVMQLWTNFAKFGNPDGESSSSSKSSSQMMWRPFSPSTLDYFNIVSKNASVMLEQLRSEQVSFWNSVVPTLHDRIETLQRTGLRSGSSSSSLQTSILAVVSIVQMLLLLLALFLLLRMRRKCQVLSKIQRGGSGL